MRTGKSRRSCDKGIHAFSRPDERQEEAQRFIQFVAAIEVLEEIGSRILADLFDARRVVRKFKNCFGELLIIAGLHEHSSIRRLDHITDHTVNNQHCWPRRRHIIKDLVRICGAKHRDVLKDRQAKV